MARGRLISRTLGSSRKFAALQKEAGKLAEFCQVLYPLIVANTDDFGRMAGDAFTVKHAVFPSSPRRESEFHDALVALHNVRLVQIYKNGADDVLSVVEFERHQPGLSKRTKSRFSEPPVNFTEFREIPKQLNGIEEKGREGKRTELIRSPNESGTAHEDVDDRRKEENREIHAFIGTFCRIYTKHRKGASYFIKKEKHVPLIRAMLKTFGAERLESLALMLLQTDDDWVHHTDRGIEILSVKASWLDNKLAEYESIHGPIKVTA